MPNIFTSFNPHSDPVTWIFLIVILYPIKIRHCLALKPFLPISSSMFFPYNINFEGIGHGLIYTLNIKKTDQLRIQEERGGGKRRSDINGKPFSNACLCDQ